MDTGFARDKDVQWWNKGGSDAPFSRKRLDWKTRSGLPGTLKREKFFFFWELIYTKEQQRNIDLDDMCFISHHSKFLEDPE